MTTPSAQTSARVDALLAVDLFGRHVERRPNDRSGLGDGSGHRIRRDGSRQAEVEHLDLDRVRLGRASEENVLRFQIAVHDALGVRCAEGAGNGADDAERLLRGQRCRAREQGRERLAGEQLHDHEGRALAVRSQKSKTWTTLRWVICAATLASRRKRAASAASRLRSTLMATAFSVVSCRASQTNPMPPSPRGRTSR